MDTHTQYMPGTYPLHTTLKQLGFRRSCECEGFGPPGSVGSYSLVGVKLASPDLFLFS